jgi:RNA polymerase sigma-70 factor (ECF subfamily)
MKMLPESGSSSRHCVDFPVSVPRARIKQALARVYMADDARRKVPVWTRASLACRGPAAAAAAAAAAGSAGTVGRVADLDLEDIYARHRQGLFTLALSITRCAARAEDAVHDAFVRLCRRRSASAASAASAVSAGTDIAPGADPVAYVFASVRNAAVDLVRRAPPDQGRAASIFAGAWSSHADAGADAGALDAERRGWVARAIDALPPEQREAIVLRVYAGLSFAQIAEAVDAPLQTVASRYRRGLERLRHQLAKLV